MGSRKGIPGREEKHEQRLRGSLVCTGEGQGWVGVLQVLGWSVEMRHAEEQGHHSGGLHFIIYSLGATTVLNSQGC